jgi:hypothetical protein
MAVRLSLALSPFYVKSFPINDPWNTPYQIGTGVDGVSAMGYLDGLRRLILAAMTS